MDLYLVYIVKFGRVSIRSRYNLGVLGSYPTSP